MNQLITNCLMEKDVSPLIEFPQELMLKFEQKMVAWILEYKASYGKAPSISRMQKAFPHFVPISYADGMDLPPLGDIADQTRARKLRAYWLNSLNNAIMSLTEEEEELPIEMIDQLQLVTSVASGISSFSTFDREKYFRHGILNVGLRLIDKATGGLGKGEMMVVAGRLGSGKTFTSLFFALEWWKQGKRVLFISNEMLPADIFARLDGIFGGFSPLFLRSASAAREIGEEMIGAVSVKVLAESKETGGEIYVPNQRLMTPQAVFSLAKNLQVDAIVIDGLYMMSPSDRAYGAKWEKVAAISNEVKQLALAIEVPVLALTQIKRTGGKKDEYDPEDIAYSDAIGQDADFIIAIAPGTVMKERMEMQLIKNRFGPSLSTLVSIDFEKMTLTEDSTTITEEDDFFRAPPEPVGLYKTTRREEEGEKMEGGVWVSDDEELLTPETLAKLEAAGHVKSDELFTEEVVERLSGITIEKEETSEDWDW